MEPSIQLPSDVQVLANAVHFTTGSRAHAPMRIWDAMHVENQPANYALTNYQIEAFQHFVTATEDLTSWIMVLSKWIPDQGPDASLFSLVRDTRPSDKEAEIILDSLTAEKFQVDLLHLPSDLSNVAGEEGPEGVAKLKDALPFKMSGFKNIVSRRLNRDRAMVRAFNKTKHLMPVFVDPSKDPPTLHFMIGDKTIPTRDYEMEVLPKRVRYFASQAMASHAVLHDTLATILKYRYGEEYRPSTWASVILSLPIWDADYDDTEPPESTN